MKDGVKIYIVEAAEQTDSVVLLLHYFNKQMQKIQYGLVSVLHENFNGNAEFIGQSSLYSQMQHL